MIAEYRNNMYIVSGFQLSEISAVVDALTVVRHALCSESVSREVIEAVVEIAQGTLGDTLDYILEHQKTEVNIEPE
ncbi:MAG TPA: hypothetical protein H9682_00340 [Firmicutes bacterium]|nr:hypothetical protein [Bacillota bacterium]